MKNKMKRWIIILLALASWTTSAFALVETDNHLLGVLKKQGFTVVQDLGEIMAKKQGLPALKIIDHTPTEYAVSSRLNTMMFSGTHVRGLQEYASANNGNDGFALKADTKGRWVLVTWQMPTGRSGAHYAKQLSDWKTNITSLNSDVMKEMDLRGPDATAGSDPVSGKDIEFRLDDALFELIRIEPGTFMMGSENGDDDEKPVHKVTISRPFWMGKTEVTQKQWLTLMGGNPSNFKGDTLPVEQVSWDQAMKFCGVLTDEAKRLGLIPDGYVFRLPTEAEWEYAGRAGETGEYCFGNLAGRLGNYAWFSGNSGDGTHPVGEKQPNTWGLYDMHGNVWEWCYDKYDSDFYAKTEGAADPVNLRIGSFRVRRGGSWGYDASGCRVADRLGGDPAGAGGYLGFRVALAPAVH